LPFGKREIDVTNYWHPVETQWREKYRPALEPLLTLTASTHELFAEVATHSAVTEIPPSEQKTVERALLRRLGEDLRAVELLAETGHGFQAITLTSSLFEQSHFLTYVSNSEAKAKEFLSWDRRDKAMAISIKDLVRASGAIRLWSVERIAEEYETYQYLCGFKHNNPMFMRMILLPSDPDRYLAQLCLSDANWFVLTSLGLFVTFRFPGTECSSILDRCNVLLDETKKHYPRIPESRIENSLDQ
jgi:hypothetical protein